MPSSGRHRMHWHDRWRKWEERRKKTEMDWKHDGDSMYRYSRAKDQNYYQLSRRTDKTASSAVRLATGAEDEKQVETKRFSNRRCSECAEKLGKREDEVRDSQEIYGDRLRFSAAGKSHRIAGPNAPGSI
uniref:Uncharacterized protein n=1 Tax=Oryza punctata TaxID=4537 RepID=A0A0E0KBI0_ORYPU